MYRAILVLGLSCVLVVPAVGQIRWQDDFTTVATYNSDALEAPCTGGPSTKYTYIAALDGDYYNEWAVSGGGRLRVSNKKLGNAMLPVGRVEVGYVGAVNVGQGCPDVVGVPLLQSTVTFTNNDICIYGAFTFNRFQLQHAKLGLGDDLHLEYGPDVDPGTTGVQNGPGVYGVDDDGNGTTDDPNTEGTNPGVSREYLWPGADGKYGVAGVNDDGINGVDDQGEFGWPGSDDSDDTIGEWGIAAAMKVDLQNTAMIFCDIDPMSTTNQFTIREIYNSELPNGPENDEIGPGFFDPFKDYNYVFCGSGTCFGAAMWVGADMANISETIGPIINSNHTAPPAINAGTSVFHINNGQWCYLRNATAKGNTNFSNKFWIVEGSPSVYYPAPSPDLDSDLDVDGFDFLTFSNCYNGSNKPPLAACTNLLADLDRDGDVDGFDFLTFSNCYNGSNRKPLTACFPPNLTACGS